MIATINKILKRLRPRRKVAAVGYTTNPGSYVVSGPSVTTNTSAWTGTFVQGPIGATGSQSHGDPTGVQGCDLGYVQIRDEVELPSLPMPKPPEPELPDGMVGLCWEEPLPMVMGSFCLGDDCFLKTVKGNKEELRLVPFGTVWVDREVPA